MYLAVSGSFYLKLDYVRLLELFGGGNEERGVLCHAKTYLNVEMIPSLSGT